MSNKTKNSFKKQEKKNFKLPAMCDKILFALPVNNQVPLDTSLQYKEFTVYEDLKKSRNKLIYITFEY
jgi:hypothetical protein